MYYLIKEGDTFNLFVDIDLANRFVYQWQKSDIYGSNWIDLSDTLIDNTILFWIKYEYSQYIWHCA